MSSADDHLAIQQVLHRYCRAMDRMDAELTLECFEPEARMDYGRLFKGSPQEFVTWLWPVHARMIGHNHLVSNTLIEFHSAETAVSETYVQVTLRMVASGEEIDVVGHGRYLDRWGRRPDGQWRITGRTYIPNLSTVVPVATRDVGSVLEPLAPGLAPLEGHRDDTDLSYSLFTPR